MQNAKNISNIYESTNSLFTIKILSIISLLLNSFHLS